MTKNRLVAATLLCTAGALIVAGQTPDDQAGVQPLARGPIHEAFARPFEADVRPGPIVPKQPPNPIEEVPPDQQPGGDNVVWIPGYWAWDDERADFIWVSGCWRDVPPNQAWVPGYWAQADGGCQWVPGFWTSSQETEEEFLPPPPASVDEGPSTPAPDAQSVYIPGVWVYRQNQYAWRPGFWLPWQQGWVFNPARYFWTPAGYVFSEGFWDYPLAQRGLPFAPMQFTQPLWNQPGWAYQPNSAIVPSLLSSALFVRPLVDSYYFGNYFEPRYAQAGFVPWLDHHIARNVPDPLVSHYRGQHDVNEFRRQYAQRRAGTSSQQLDLVAPLTKVAGQVSLHQVSPAQRDEQRRHATAVRAAATQRHQADTHAVKKAAQAGAPARVKAALPRVAPARPTTVPAAAIRRAPPAHPTLPPHVARPAPARAPLAPHRFEARAALHPAAVPGEKATPKPKVESKVAPHPKVEVKPPAVHPKPAPKTEEKAKPAPRPVSSSGAGFYQSGQIYLLSRSSGSDRLCAS
jgi:hypothetical protein